ncbi:MAG: VanW family protein [Anaerolineae bacterium]
MKKIRVIAATACALSILLILTSVLAFELYLGNRIYPGVQVWGVPLGGKGLDEAAEALDSHLTALQQPVLILRGPERSWQIRPADLGLRLVAEATAQEAFRVGRGPSEGLFAHLRLLLFGHSPPPILSYDEATARLYLETLAEEIDRQPVDAALTLEGTTPISSPAESGRALDVAATLSAVESSLGDLVGGGRIDLVMREISPQVTDAEPARERAELLLSEPFLLMLPNPREGDPGPWQLSPEELAGLLTTFAVDGRLEATLDEQALRSYLEGLAPALAVEPVNARFHFDEAAGQLEVIAPSTEGRALDLEASLRNVLAAVEAGQHLAPLTVQSVPPTYSETATAEALGIRELVGEGDSYFIGSPSGRDHNIRLAASRFDGVVIGPGETFSFNEYLGEVSAEAGYDESYVTAGEQLAIEVGGGICQVSTTAFRAALWGGYPITERWYHYQRVGYYELRGYGPGFDATVYSPVVDFKFANDRSAALLIDTEVEEETHRLVFRFYSTDDGRELEIEGPEITDETEPGPPIYELDESLDPGTMIRWQSATNGLTATVERWVRDSEGNLLHHDTFVSQYAPRRAAYHYGPGYDPQEETSD